MPAHIVEGHLALLGGEYAVCVVGGLDERKLLIALVDEGDRLLFVLDDVGEACGLLLPRVLGFLLCVVGEGFVFQVLLVVPRGDGDLALLLHLDDEEVCDGLEDGLEVRGCH